MTVSVPVGGWQDSTKILVIQQMSYYPKKK